MTHIKQREEDYLLSTQAIDRLSQICSDSLTEAGADGKDILRIRLSLEEILSGWLSRLGENTPCFCRTGTRFGRQFFEIRAKGVEAMPDGMDGPDTGEFLYGRLMAQAGLSLVYTYKDGMNCLTVNPPKKSHLPQSAQLAVAIASAGVVGVLCTALPEAAQAVLRGVVDPAFDTLLGALRALSSPLIFFAVCCGIISIGDLSTLGKIGKKALSRMCVSTFATGVCMLLAVVWLFPVSWTGAGDASGFGEIYRLFLEIIPSDIVSPFVEGNACVFQRFRHGLFRRPWKLQRDFESDADRLYSKRPFHGFVYGRSCTEAACRLWLADKKITADLFDWTFHRFFFCRAGNQSGNLRKKAWDAGENGQLYDPAGAGTVYARIHHRIYGDIPVYGRKQRA